MGKKYFCREQGIFLLKNWICMGIQKVLQSILDFPLFTLPFDVKHSLGAV